VRWVGRTAASRAPRVQSSESHGCLRSYERVAGRCRITQALPRTSARASTASRLLRRAVLLTPGSAAGREHVAGPDNRNVSDLVAAGGLRRSDSPGRGAPLPVAPAVRRRAACRTDTALRGVRTRRELVLQVVAWALTSVGCVRSYGPACSDHASSSRGEVTMRLGYEAQRLGLATCSVVQVGEPAARNRAVTDVRRAKARRGNAS
jgi:hypothetical protein